MALSRVLDGASDLSMAMDVPYSWVCIPGWMEGVVESLAFRGLLAAALPSLL